MAWKKPRVIEISLAMEINCYACAEAWSGCDGRGRPRRRREAPPLRRGGPARSRPDTQRAAGPGV